jgi:Mlc titration factor MtfA (ptsG expression regulator)
MEPVLLLLAAAALIAVAYLALSRFLLRIRWHRPLKFRAEPIPETWHAIIDRNVPLTRKLPPDQLTRLLRLTQLFLHDKHIEGCGGLEVTEEIRVTVAAQACVLLLGIDAGCYPGLRTVLLYPTPYRKTETATHAGGWKEESVQWNAGEAWSRGIVGLAWNHALHGARNAFDGRNVILHVLERNLGLLRKALEKRRKTVMREYGATNKAEFFAVATETFFEKPRQLHKRRPDLYDALQRVYGMDPEQSQMMAPTDDRL